MDETQPHCKGLIAPEIKSMQQDPAQVITSMLGKPVVVRLNSNLDYRGSLISLDGYMNVALQSAEEYLGEVFRRKYGDVFIRGNNGKQDFAFAI